MLNRSPAVAALILAWTLAASLAAQEDEPAAESAPAAAEPSPLEAIEAASRSALGQLGLERVEVEAAGDTLVAFRGGSGPDLVLLHGAGQQAGAWVLVLPGLLPDYTVHALDLPGHGESGPLDGPLPVARVYAGLEAYLETLDGPAILVGNSMGAWLATIEAHRHPERVARAVLVNGGALLNVPAEGLTLMPPDREAARRVMAAIRDPASPPIPDPVLDDVVRRAASGPIGRMMADPSGFGPFLLDGHLAEVEVPVEILWGVSDQLMPLAYAERMARELTRARLTEIETCGHIPPSECPTRFLSALRRVLELEPPTGEMAAPEVAGPPGGGS